MTPATSGGDPTLRSMLARALATTPFADRIDDVDEQNEYWASPTELADYLVTTPWLADAERMLALMPELVAALERIESKSAVHMGDGRLVDIARTAHAALKTVGSMGRPR